MPGGRTDVSNHFPPQGELADQFLTLVLLNGAIRRESVAMLCGDGTCGLNVADTVLSQKEGLSYSVYPAAVIGRGFA